MIPINLLPYRAERRRELQKQFTILAALTVLIGGIVWFLGHSFLEGRINNQNQRNKFLETKIAELDKKISNKANNHKQNEVYSVGVLCKEFG